MSATPFVAVGQLCREADGAIDCPYPATCDSAHDRHEAVNDLPASSPKPT